MKVYRLCHREEIESIVQNKSFAHVGKRFSPNENKNTHRYNLRQKYLHFFQNAHSIMYLNCLKGRYIAVYDLPEALLEKRKGTGKYRDFVSFSNLRTVEEYAISTRQLKPYNLVAVYEIVHDIDYEDIWLGDPIAKFVKKRPLRTFDLQQEK